MGGEIMKKVLAVVAISMMLTMGFAAGDAHAYRGTPGPKWTCAPGWHHPHWHSKWKGFHGRGYRGCWLR